jgi:hypothetical protein
MTRVRKRSRHPRHSPSPTSSPLPVMELDWRLCLLVPLPGACMTAIFMLVPTGLPPTLRATLALSAAAFSLSLPEILPLGKNIPFDVFVRLCYSFLAMKLLDIAVARRHAPPVLQSQGKLPIDWPARIRYALALTQETRYEDFDISVASRSRPLPPPAERTLHHVLCFVVVPALYFFVHTAEVNVLFVLVCIYAVFESGHSILRPGSRTPLFNYPFLQPTLGAFWSKGWHTIILSPLQSIAIEPASALGGRTAGVLAAFAFSGLWHGYAVVPMGGLAYAWKIVAVFVMQGVGCLLEHAIWGRERTALRRIVIWAWSLGWGGWALRAWEDRAAWGL